MNLGKQKQAIMATLLDPKGTTFFEMIRNKEGLDLRDNRGKRHCFSVVIFGIIMALYRNRDGNLSSIHRCLTNKQAELCQALNIDYTPAVSRAQLPIILKKRILQSFQSCTLYF